MSDKPSTLLRTAASVALTAILAAIGALVVSRLYPGSFFSAFWPCFGGALLVAFVLGTFNMIEASVACGVYLILAVVSIPAGERLGVPVIPAYIIVSLVCGMLSSRATYRMSRGDW